MGGVDQAHNIILNLVVDPWIYYLQQELYNDSKYKKYETIIHSNTLDNLAETWNATLNLDLHKVSVCL